MSICGRLTAERVMLTALFRARQPTHATLTSFCVGGSLLLSALFGKVPVADMIAGIQCVTQFDDLSETTGDVSRMCLYIQNVRPVTAWHDMKPST